MQKEKQPTSMTSIILTDTLFMTPFGLLSALGIIALGVLSLFIGVCGLTYLVKSFFFSSALQIVGGLAMSIMALGVTALFGYVEYLLGKTTYNGIKSYLKDRKQAVAIIKKSQEIMKENKEKNDTATTSTDTQNKDNSEITPVSNDTENKEKNDPPTTNKPLNKKDN